MLSHFESILHTEELNLNQLKVELRHFCGLDL